MRAMLHLNESGEDRSVCEANTTEKRRRGWRKWGRHCPVAKQREARSMRLFYLGPERMNNEKKAWPTAGKSCDEGSDGEFERKNSAVNRSRTRENDFF